MSPLTKEIKRVKDITFDTYSYLTNCIECGREIELKEYGGELDYTECCGLTYSLRTEQVDFVISKDD